jgi:mRNA-degrading endonuclease RelE of RelBE toxin-antitoxin system
MEHDYSIENLAATFEKHAQELDKDTEELLKKFMEEDPEEPIPKYIDNPFNLPRALCVMMKEIDRLRQICK